MVQVASRPGVRKRTRWVGWLFVAPVVIGTLLFEVLPMLPMFWLSLTDSDGFTEANFIGTRNYQRLFESELFVGSVQRTFVYTAIVVIGSMAAGLGMAMLVYRGGRRDRFFRAIYFIPFITSQVAIGVVWRWIFDHDRGPINSFLGLLGIRGPEWLLQAHTAFIAVIVVSIWFFMGYNMILYLAGLRRIPRELGEAAAVDGATPFQRFRYITLPLLSPTTLVATIINTLVVFEVFGLIFVMTAGGPGVSTEIYLFRLWREAFEFFRIGSASAMGVILLLIMLILAVTQFLLSRKWVFYE